MEINRLPEGEQAEAIYSELTMGRESVSYHYSPLAETQRQAGESEGFPVGKGKASGVLRLELVDMGTLEAGSLDVGTSYGVGLGSLFGFLWSVLRRGVGGAGSGNKKKQKEHCRQSSSANPPGTAACRRGGSGLHCHVPSGHSLLGLSGSHQGCVYHRN